ncbi:MAG: DUF3306 domain-containing protein [Planktotalea sp.]|uniref:DUF3306 domain-containing protein n=1 Tax=Planktotalea sp. TaxID=2029877 RepID=UPI000183950F|nr:DUF3306 domain-containing protein [Planktotalea sp.]EDZ44381.1 conserved hypothetical protein [Rhodobacteraceae bacterium HTCC2083]MBT5821503.1 DUF3306 domain-containing protein [Paracoccaceae bacterium]MDG1078253.1 DUF3306 domain-containing protein [Planktotalea sp.]MDG1085772.1 DUF3306 domain-containing protein [Planktotalea sp.]HCW86340.1 DUF3306 domain-containing protein [Paracoccaceae bacterium]
MSGEHDFWARRRAGVAAEAKAEQDAVEAKVLAEEHAALEELSEAEMLAELDLPNPDTMVQGDDFSVFMAKAVPDQLRRRALRTLWRSNPVLANVDMLVDYGEDFTDAALAVENIQTAYQVGKGMLKHVEEMARQAEELENPTIVEEPEHEESVDDEILSAEAEESPQIEDDAPEQIAALDEEEAYATPVPRRMKFRIEEHA